MGRKRSERVRHVVDTEEDEEQTVGSGPWDFDVVDVGAEKLMFNLVCEAPHSRSKAGHDNRGINSRSSIG